MVASRLLARRGVALWAMLLLAVVAAQMWPTPPNPDLLTYIRPGDEADVSGLFVLDPARNLDAPLVPFTGNGPAVFAYAWSPDGRWLAYATGGSRVMENGQVTLQGPGGITRTYPVPNGVQGTGFQWHPDGARLVAILQPNRILTIDPATGDSDEVVAFDLQFINPRSQLVLNPREMVVQGQGVQARRPSYFTISLASGAARPSDNLPCLDDAPRDMALSPDGSQLIYGCFDAQVLFVAPTDNPDERQPFAPLSELGRLGTEGVPRWSPDGSRVLFNHYPMFTQPNEPPYTVYIANLMTGAIERVRVPRDYRDLGWLPVEALRRGR